MKGIVTHHWSWYFWGVIATIGTVIEFLCSFKQIPNRPVHVGVPIIAGKRVPAVLPEGWYFFFLYFYTATLVNVEKKTLEVTFPDIRTKMQGDQSDDPDKPLQAGGEVSVNISLTWAPNYKKGDKPDDNPGESLVTYLNSGGEKGVNTIITSVLEEEIREMGAKYSWEEIAFNRDEIRKALVLRLTGETITEQQERRMKNGLPVVMDLGVKIYRLNVGRVKEQGDLAKAAELQAVEQQQKAGEKVELGMLLEIGEKMMKQDPKMSLKEAITAIQVAQGKIKDVQVVSGVEGLILKAMESLQKKS